MCTSNMIALRDGLAAWPLMTYSPERRLRAWRPDIRYTILSSYLSTHSVQPVSFTLCVTFHCQNIVYFLFRWRYLIHSHIGAAQKTQESTFKTNLYRRITSKLTPNQQMLGLPLRTHRQTSHARQMQTSPAKLRRPRRTRAQPPERAFATAEQRLAQKQQQIHRARETHRAPGRKRERTVEAST